MTNVSGRMRQSTTGQRRWQECVLSLRSLPTFRTIQSLEFARLTSALGAITSSRWWKNRQVVGLSHLNKTLNVSSHQAFLYDSTITAPLSNPPLWPYTMYFRMPHRCHGNLQSCPTRSHAVWEMVMNELDRREDPNIDEDIPGCAMVDSCSNILTGNLKKKSIQDNLQIKCFRWSILRFPESQLWASLRLKSRTIGTLFPRCLVEEQSRIPRRLPLLDWWDFGQSQRRLFCNNDTSYSVDAKPEDVRRD